MTVTLYLGDCLEILPTLTANSVDVAMTDPPFSIPVKYQDAKGEYPRSWGDLAVMEPWAALMLGAIRRMVKPTGQVYVCCDANTYPVFYKASLPLWPRSHLLIWYKPTGRRGNGWKHSYELILHLAGPETVYTEGWRQDVIGIMPVRTLNREHPAEKPGDLWQWLLEAVPEGATVLDPFMGSGSSGAKAAQLGYSFIGCEIDPTYYAIAERRIAEAQQQLAMPLEMAAT